ncbi:phosphoglucomutase [Bacteroides sp.]
MNIFFGTDGWRAHIDTEINEETVSVVAQAFADFIHRNYKEESPRVALAYDTRKNSQLFATTFAEVLSGNRIQALLADRITPTPVLSYATLHLDCCAGVMITASHNPPSYNGIKFKSRLGGPFNSDDTRKVESYLYTSPVVRSTDHVHKINLIPSYIEHIENRIDFETIRKAGLNLLVDSMGGAGLTLIQEILHAHNCPAQTIYSEASDTFHGRLAEPIEKNLSPLKEALKEGHFALGVATDGDADRVGVCMDTGEWLSAQDTILLLVDYLKRVKQIPGGIVKTSSVSDKVRSAFESPQTPVYEVQVGFKYIADIMTAHPIAFGGEESGGFGYGMHIPERDGIFSSLLLLEMLSASPYHKMSDYLEERRKEMGTICYDRIDMAYAQPDKNELLPWLYKNPPHEIAGFGIRKIMSFLSSRGIVNGLKFVFEGDCRWLLIRSSETEDIIRFYAEGQTGKEVSLLLQYGQNLLFKVSDSIANPVKH